MLSMLDSKQLNLVKGTVIGMLLPDNKNPRAIEIKNCTLPESVRCNGISFQEMFLVVCICTLNIPRFLSCVSIR